MRCSEPGWSVAVADIASVGRVAEFGSLHSISGRTLPAVALLPPILRNLLCRLVQPILISGEPNHFGRRQTAAAPRRCD
jgi:hypothetical protein